MLEQLSDQSKDQKLEKLSEFLTDLDEHLKTAKDFKTEHPERDDLNALIELNLAIQEEARAVSNLVEIEDDCPEDWEDLEEARGSHFRTLARITHRNWIDQGPSNSRRFNQLFFHFGGGGVPTQGATIISELLDVSKGLLAQELSSGLRTRIQDLIELLGGGTEKGFLLELNEQLQHLEDFLEIALFDQSSLNEDTLICAVCTAEVSKELKECPSCGAAVLQLNETKKVETQQKRGSSQLLDSLWDAWNQFQAEESDQDTLLETLRVISKPILEVVVKLDSPSPRLLDFSQRLENFTKLSDRDALERDWPALIASGRALIDERISLLKRD